MTVTTVETPPTAEYSRNGITHELLLDMWRKMVLIRRFEEMVEEIFVVRKTVTGPSHLSIGQEAIAAGVMTALGPQDAVFSNYRGHGHALARGVPPGAVMAELLGKRVGTCKGVGGSMHSAKYPELGLMYATAIVGSQIPIAAGYALTFKLRREPRVVAVLFGDGAANIGAFHEGANIAGIWGLPLLLICENNQYAISMPAQRAVAGPGIAYRAEAYGMPGVVVDGNDPVAVFIATKQAAERARRGEGATLLECRTYRLKGHGVYDRAAYRPAVEVEAATTRDPLRRFRETMVTAGLTAAEELDALDDQSKRETQQAFTAASQADSLSLDDLHALTYA